jgi:hypothetical protein
MKTSRKLLRVGIGGVVVVALSIVALALMTFNPSNDLGLSRFDLAIGKVANIETLRAKTKAVADVYLSKHEAELKEICGGTYELTADSSLTPKIRSLGCRSSFYYYCWDIYLPYPMKPNSHSAYIVAVQLSDATQDNTHNPDKFRVLRVMVIDQHHQIVRTLE